MVDREEEDIQMSLQGTLSDAKRSKLWESTEAEESPEARTRRVQRELMAVAAEKRIRASASVIPKPKTAVVVAREEAAKPSVSREEAEKPSISREEGDGPVERREVEIGEELSPEHVEQLLTMVFRSGVSREIPAPWINQGVRIWKLI